MNTAMASFNAILRHDENVSAKKQPHIKGIPSKRL